MKVASGVLDERAWFRERVVRKGKHHDRAVEGDPWPGEIEVAGHRCRELFAVRRPLGHDGDAIAISSEDRVARRIALDLGASLRIAKLEVQRTSVARR